MRTLRSFFRLAPLVAAATLLAACDGSSTDSGSRDPAHLDVVSGTPQQAAVGTPLANPLVVRVTDAAGRPVAGQLVSFTVVSGGGTLAAAGAQTDANGQAQTQWTLGTVAADSQKVEARIERVGSTPLVATFRATATPGAAARVVAVSPATVSTVPFGGTVDSLVARVVDANGNPVPGVTVSWAVTSGGGTVTPATAVSRADGTVKAQWTLGTQLGARQIVHAFVGALPDAVFEATATARAAGTVVITRTGDDQTATAGAQLQPFTVTARLPDGRPVSNVPVTWRLGNAVLGTGTTNAQGQASFTGTAPMVVQTGTYLFGADLGTGGTAVFTVHVVPGPAVSLTGVSGPLPGSVTPGTQITVYAVALDQYGNGVPGVTVNWVVTAGNSTPSPTQGVTDANGSTSTTWTIGAKTAYTGNNVMQAQSPGLAPYTFTAGPTQ